LAAYPLCCPCFDKLAWQARISEFLLTALKIKKGFSIVSFLIEIFH
jgi:hypothetical protein